MALVRLVARNRRRYGGYIVHVGIVILFAAFAGLAFKEEFDVTLKGGETYEATDPYGNQWRFVSQGVSRYDELNRQTTAVLLDSYRNGKKVGVIKTEKRQYTDSRGVPTFQPATEVGIMEGIREDVYVVLAGVIGEDTAEMRITFNPLVWWVWYGGLIMAIGGLDRDVAAGGASARAGGIFDGAAAGGAGRMNDECSDVRGAASSRPRQPARRCCSRRASRARRKAKGRRVGRRTPARRTR